MLLISCASAAIRKHVPGRLACVRRQRTRWDEDNEAPLNPWAIVTVGAIILGLAGLVLGFSLT